MGTHKKSDAAKRKATYTQQKVRTRANKMKVLSALVKACPNNGAYKMRLAFWQGHV